VPAQWMCPECARLVDPRASGCHHCGCTFGRRRPVHVKGSGHDLTTFLRPVPAWALCTALLVGFALVARGQVVIAQVYVWTLVAGATVGWCVLAIQKFQEDGLVGLFEFFLRGRWFLHDDPLDSWMIVLLILILEGLGLMWFIIHPTMPPAWWP
jgi:hypothetical protein